MTSTSYIFFFSMDITGTFSSLQVAMILQFIESIFNVMYYVVFSCILHPQEQRKQDVNTRTAQTKRSLLISPFQKLNAVILKTLLFVLLFLFFSLLVLIFLLLQLQLLLPSLLSSSFFFFRSYKLIFDAL